MHEDAQELYDHVLFFANQFLTHCKHFSIEVLAKKDPSYEELADVMSHLSKIIAVLADDFDPMMGQKAFDYSNQMRKMAQAIGNDDEDLLSELVQELDRRPFL